MQSPVGGSGGILLQKSFKVKFWNKNFGHSEAKLACCSVSFFFLNLDCYIAGVFPATARPFIGWFIVT